MFLASKLSTLADNLITPGFEKFRETAKAFVPRDMDLVTRKGVYEFTDSWDKLEKTILPKRKYFFITFWESIEICI